MKLLIIPPLLRQALSKEIREILRNVGKLDSDEKWRHYPRHFFPELMERFGFSEIFLGQEASVTISPHSFCTSGIDI